MKLEYIQSTNTGPQYKITLNSDTCDLTFSYVKTNLQAATASIQAFPSFTLKVISKASRTYILDITFKDTVLNAANMNFILSFLKASALIPKQFIPSQALQEIAEAVPTAASAVSAGLGTSFVGTLSLGASAALWSMIN